MNEIVFIYADNCFDCERMRIMLYKAKAETKLNYNIKDVNSETQEAIDIAIDNGIDDLPACIIGDTVMYGKRGFTYEKILKAFKELQ